MWQPGRPMLTAQIPLVSSSVSSDSVGVTGAPVFHNRLLIARGSYGMVFRARAEAGDEVCLKEVPLTGLTPVEITESIHEAELLRSLRYDRDVHLRSCDVH